MISSIKDCSSPISVSVFTLSLNTFNLVSISTFFFLVSTFILAAIFSAFVIKYFLELSLLLVVYFLNSSFNFCISSIPSISLFFFKNVLNFSVAFAFAAAAFAAAFAAFSVFSAFSAFAAFSAFSAFAASAASFNSSAAFNSSFFLTIFS